MVEYALPTFLAASPALYVRVSAIGIVCSDHRLFPTGIVKATTIGTFLMEYGLGAEVRFASRRGNEGSSLGLVLRKHNVVALWFWGSCRARLAHLDQIPPVTAPQSRYTHISPALLSMMLALSNAPMA